MVNINLRLPDELHSTLTETAKQSHRSLNGEILHALEFYLTHSPEAQYKVQLPPAEEKAPRKKKAK
jgi:hypothetical protein